MAAPQQYATTQNMNRDQDLWAIIGVVQKEKLLSVPNFMQQAIPRCRLGSMGHYRNLSQAKFAQSPRPGPHPPNCTQAA